MAVGHINSESNKHCSEGKQDIAERVHKTDTQGCEL